MVSIYFKLNILTRYQIISSLWETEPVFVRTMARFCIRITIRNVINNGIKFTIIKSIEISLIAVPNFQEKLISSKKAKKWKPETWLKKFLVLQFQNIEWHHRTKGSLQSTTSPFSPFGQPNTSKNSWLWSKFSPQIALKYLSEKSDGTFKMGFNFYLNIIIINIYQKITVCSL